MDQRNNGLVPLSPRDGPVADDPKLLKQLQDLERQHVQRQMINRSRLVLGEEAVRGVTDLSVSAHDTYGTGVTQMVAKYHSVPDDPMVREPFEIYTRREIAELGNDVRRIVRNTADDITAELRKPYRVQERRRGLIERILGD